MQMQKSGQNSHGTKSRRVRTGCLTCRERHLKCDEASPRCQNCSKSGRVCKRGIRLNFIDTQTAAPPHSIAPLPGTQVSFQDESREIASEYVGGAERYPPLRQTIALVANEAPPPQFDFANTLNTSLLSSFPGAAHSEIPESILSEQQYATTHQFHGQNVFLPKMSMTPTNDHPCITNPEEVLLLQVFVEEVALWMDSMDAGSHFTNIIPYHALNEPLLLNAILACGARHLHLVNASFGEDRAVHYYNAASRDLLVHLENPHRDRALCATAAVILNVYEVMCESAMQRMNHIAGARALIKECRWNGKSPGIGGACFWINVGMELLSCLHFNWRMSWDPDTWDMDIETELVPSDSLFGDEESWTHRMLYICAKIANFRAILFQMQGSDRQSPQLRLQQRCHEWDTYKRWCDEWARCIPRSMVPICYLQPWQTTSKSAFPEVWLVKRSAVVGRLFYHTACILLAKTHPLESEFSPNMRDMQQKHAYDICGIVAHVKDRGVATTSIRCLAIAAECLVSREAQEEVLQIINKIIKETGWRISFLKDELQTKWGWNADSHQHSEARASTTAATVSTANNGTSTPMDTVSLLNPDIPPAPPPPRSRIPPGIINPMMATADFSMANHPYQEHYVAPHSDLESYHYAQY
ncbi:hypothetical protein UA08_06521 [Talaromyces atroroseus]|uniref:Zn(2)-C6 fungal-type domain-containing protein n=1 Tax=Talaromyces atroroseus TaxID=1441469 RepID=A0A225AQQ2_TALAT|nr:hypothetical protein UA08_06521 [Talaromyces atroroseus]OKL57939.1 hypothetical protein UA08_06521 [Talaromyces atroroseus]